MSDVEYVAHNHVVSLACGQMLGPGETSTKVDPSNPGDRAQIDGGHLTLIDPEPQVKATEPAINKAAELGVDLDDVKGTGKGGQIKVEDVEEAHREKEERNASGI